MTTLEIILTTLLILTVIGLGFLYYVICSLGTALCVILSPFAAFFDQKPQKKI